MAQRCAGLCQIFGIVLVVIFAVQPASAIAQSVVLERDTGGYATAMQSQDPFCGWGLTVPDGTYAQMGVAVSGYRQYAHNDGTYYGPSWNPSSMYLEGEFLPSQTLTCAAALYVPPGVDA